MWFVAYRQQVSLCALILFLAGCAEKVEILPLAKVTGQVKMDNMPLTAGTIIFVPDGSRGTKGRMAVGQIGKDGTYQLTTYVPLDGAQVGFHRVAIQCYAPAKYEVNATAPPPSISMIPEQYSNESLSGLTAEVKRGQTEPISFHLFSKP